MFQAFDVLWLDGRDLIDRPLWQRKNRLHEIIAPGAEFAAVDFVDDEGIAFYDAVLETQARRHRRQAEEQPLHAPASARRTGSRSARCRAATSSSAATRSAARDGKGEPFSQLLLGAYDGGSFEYVGAVSGGLSDAEARQPDRAARAAGDARRRRSPTRRSSRA